MGTRYITTVQCRDPTLVHFYDYGPAVVYYGVRAHDDCKRRSYTYDFVIQYTATLCGTNILKRMLIHNA